MYNIQDGKTFESILKSVHDLNNWQNDNCVCFSSIELIKNNIEHHTLVIFLIYKYGEWFCQATSFAIVFAAIPRWSKFEVCLLSVITGPAPAVVHTKQIDSLFIRFFQAGLESLAIRRFVFNSRKGPVKRPGYHLIAPDWLPDTWWLNKENISSTLTSFCSRCNTFLGTFRLF